MSEAGHASEHRLTPSDLVLLHADRFAPLPPGSTGWWARLSFEISFFFPFALALFFCAAIGVATWRDGDADDRTVPLVAAVVAVALIVGSAWGRRRRPASIGMLPAQVCFPLLGERAALREPLVTALVATALLASEQAGELRLELSDGGLQALPAGAPSPWPADSLEGRLRRERPASVAALVAAWLADGSHFPWDRALRLAEQGLVARGVARLVRAGDSLRAGLDSQGAALARAIDSSASRELLDACRRQSPAVWQALREAVEQGVQSRLVEPRWEQRGNVMVPVYDHAEAPTWLLDAPPAAVPGPAARPEPAPVPPRPMTLRTSLALASALVVATVVRLRFFGDGAWHGAPLAGAAIGAVAYGIGLAWHASRKLAARAASGAGTPVPAPAPAGADVAAPADAAAEPVRSPPADLAGAVTVGALFALLGALFGRGWMIALLVLLGLAGAMQWSARRAPQVAAVARAIEARLRALGGASDAAPREARFDVDTAETQAHGQPWPIPLRVHAATALPVPDAAALDLLHRTVQRRLELSRLYRQGLVVFIVGYSSIALLFWLAGPQPFARADDGLPADLPVALAVAWAATAAALLQAFKSRAQRLPSVARGANDGGDGPPRPAWLVPGLTLWRAFALVHIPLACATLAAPPLGARRAGVAALALAFLAAHWLWMQRALARIAARHPVPEPLRLVLLRVFGSPSFHDLIELVAPWRRVGIVSHLEGFDTVGERSDVRAAVRAGRIDEVLVKTKEEVTRELAAISTKPDDCLLFGRHAFQCTEATWRLAIRAMLDQADAVVMDLSSLSPTNQGCAWELGLLLDRVPLSRVTLLVNDSTDMACLQDILDAAARRIAATSANRDDPAAAWNLVRIGGLSARLPRESWYDWQRRIDVRLDPLLLTARLLATAQPPRAGAGAGTGMGTGTGTVPRPRAARPRAPAWARQALLPSAVLFGLSAAAAAAAQLRIA